MSDFNITLFETCELLNRSKKSISRYVRRGLLHPERVKSQQGTLEYRFSKADIEAFKAQEALKADQTRQDQTRQDTADRPDGTPEIQDRNQLEPLMGLKIEETRQDTPDQTGQAKQDSQVITLLKETTQTRRGNEAISFLKEIIEFLRDQLKIKDEQISSLGGKIDQLIERDRETNIILKGLQDKVFILGQGKPEQIEPISTSESEETRQDTNKPEPTEARRGKQEETGQDEPAKAGFWKWLFKD